MLPLSALCGIALKQNDRNRKNKKRPATQMLFFVMYDIESNKVRRHVVKYLERQGPLEN